MSKKKKPRWKDDLKKARSIYTQYKEHQVKLSVEPDSLAADHWRKEKHSFLARVKFYVNRSKLKENGIID